MLQSKEFASFGGLPKIIESFGGLSNYEEAVKSMEKELYLPQVNSYNSAVHNSTGI